jgi:hypothetical protein
MKRLCIALMAGLWVSAAAQTPFVRARLEPNKGILIGQPVRLVVSVFVPNYFTSSPDFPEFELDNVIVVLPQERPVNSSEQAGGVTYAGITETYTIYPQQPGDFRLPPAEIRTSYASAPPKSTEVHLLLPALTFHAEVPAAAQNLDYFLPTTSLTIQQKWSSPLKNLRAGDSIERTIAVTATKMQAMLIPPIPLEAPDGIRIYPEEPSVQDQKTDRGDFVFGRRTESAKYLIQMEGDYTLPAIELKWWNLSTNRVVTATLPAVHFIATANSNYVSELPAEPEPGPIPQSKHISFWTRYKFWVRVVAPFCVGFLLLFWMAWHYFPKIRRSLEARAERREHSEAAYFRNLLNACEKNRPAEAYERLLRWVAVADPRLKLDDFLSRTAGPALASEVDALGAVLFRQTHQEQWHGKKMAELLRHHRQGTSYLRTRSDLVKLNP